MYEDAPRHPGDNFYYRQNDYIAERQRGTDWTWTIFRPGPIFGVAVGASMSPLIVLVVLTLFCSLVEMDMRFGGTPPDIAQDIDSVIAPLHIVSSYGLFAEMTTQRNEIVMQGSADGKHWRDKLPRETRHGERRTIHPSWCADGDERYGHGADKRNYLLLRRVRRE